MFAAQAVELNVNYKKTGYMFDKNERMNLEVNKLKQLENLKYLSNLQKSL